MIIAAGVLQMVVTRRAHVGAAIMVLVGLILLAASLHLLPANAWALLAGLADRHRNAVPGRRHYARPRAPPDERDQAQAFSVFGGQRVINESQQFRGASLTAFFGGITLDLRRANLAPEGADVDVMTAFGGPQIIVPVGWQVVFSGVPLRSFDDKTSHAGADARSQLRIKGTAMFGGVDAKNSP